MKLSNQTYDILKYVAITAVPVLATTTGIIGQTLAWSHTAAAVTIITALGSALAGLLGISSINYNKDNTGE